MIIKIFFLFCLFVLSYILVGLVVSLFYDEYSHRPYDDSLIFLLIWPYIILKTIIKAIPYKLVYIPIRFIINLLF